MYNKLLYMFIVFSFAIGQTVKIPSIEFSPRKYICYYYDDSLLVDGRLNEQQWEKAQWSDDFTDIRGDASHKLRFITKMKMIWNSKYLYIGAFLEEKDIKAKFLKRDTLLYKENNFEVFIDPDGDTANYCEVEINALNTIWDLLLIKPYRDMKKPAITGWDINGIKTAVFIDGTINNSNDKDSCWTVEIAIPWKIFTELTTASVPPKNYDQWRVNFSRVEWQTVEVNKFSKKKKDANISYKKADYQVWSPQGIVNMHYPEMWGYVQFSTEIVGKKNVEFINKQEEKAKWLLRKIYYKERIYFNKNNRFTADLNALGINNKKIPGFIFPPLVYCTPNMFEAIIETINQKMKIIIKNDGIINIKKK